MFKTSVISLNIFGFFIFLTQFKCYTGANPISKSPLPKSPLLPNVLEPPQQQESLQYDAQWNSNITHELFQELEQLSRIVDIAYCVGTSGISHPFVCASHCKDFPNFELVGTIHPGLAPGNSCGYIALDHGLGKGDGRILIVFRGTYSITDTIMDLSVVPQQYVPYPPDHKNDLNNSTSNLIFKELFHHKTWHSFVGYLSRIFHKGRQIKQAQNKNSLKCTNCTVHSGFWKNYQLVRPQIFPKILELHQEFPNYRLNLVGHSLGGTTAALAALELESLGYKSTVTTFGEPRIGNTGLRNFIDTKFNLPSENVNGHMGLLNSKSRYRRVTHINDPVPLLPPLEWGYRAHSGEIYISKSNLPPTIEDMRLCFSDDDIHCIAGTTVGKTWPQLTDKLITRVFDDNDSENLGKSELKRRENFQFSVPYKIWLPFFAHLDYFWRLGLCLPGGDSIS